MGNMLSGCRVKAPTCVSLQEENFFDGAKSSSQLNMLPRRRRVKEPASSSLKEVDIDIHETLLLAQIFQSWFKLSRNYSTLTNADFKVLLNSMANKKIFRYLSESCFCTLLNEIVAAQPNAQSRLQKVFVTRVFDSVPYFGYTFKPKPPSDSVVYWRTKYLSALTRYPTLTEDDLDVLLCYLLHPARSFVLKDSSLYWNIWLQDIVRGKTWLQETMNTPIERLNCVMVVTHVSFTRLYFRYHFLCVNDG